jgi:hypothetical protein
VKRSRVQAAASSGFRTDRAKVEIHTISGFSREYWGDPARGNEPARDNVLPVTIADAETGAASREPDVAGAETERRNPPC